MRPRQGGAGQRRKRRVVIDNAAARPRDARQQQREREAARPKTPREVAPITGPVTVESGVSVRDLSQALGVPAPKIIMFMMGLGKAVTITQTLADEEVELVAAELAPEREITIKHAADDDEEPETFEDSEADLAPRPPVVTIMGHVDHGKTTLLDAIRKTSVVDTEAGGITQHIGAYQVDHNGRGITFLDTPGHEAFTAMRARGAKVTDIAVLVVAADDGVMPQTKESISHARAAQVPIVVAVNKVDVPDADPNRVRSELSTEGLQPEEWGGTTQFSDVSAKQAENLDDLLEKVLLVADAELVLTANAKAEASGPIIESRLDVGRGPVATMLVHRGTLRVGDAIVAGDAWGKVRALYNFRGDKVKDAGPGDPVEILGFDKPPPAGELGRVVENERRARDVALHRLGKTRDVKLAKQGARSEDVFSTMGDAKASQVAVLIKTDVQGSAEALRDALSKLSTDEVAVRIIASGVGAITASDVQLAAASKARIIGFNVRADSGARDAVKETGVEIRYYSIIYEAIDDVKQLMSGLLAPEIRETIVGVAQVREVFRSSKFGVVAGCLVTEGAVKRNNPIRVLRDSVVIFEGALESLRRFKDDAGEVRAGTECGIGVKNYQDVRAGDQIECYSRVEVARTLQ
jgi:translation initiation factor IF-2